MEDRHGCVGQARGTQILGASAPGTAPALATAIPGDHHATLGGDQGYDTAAFVTGCRELASTLHVAKHRTDSHFSAFEGRTPRDLGYAGSQQARERRKKFFRAGRPSGTGDNSTPRAQRCWLTGPPPSAQNGLQPDPEAESAGCNNMSGAPGPLGPP